MSRGPVSPAVRDLARWIISEFSRRDSSEAPGADFGRLPVPPQRVIEVAGRNAGVVRRVAGRSWQAGEFSDDCLSRLRGGAR